MGVPLRLIAHQKEVLRALGQAVFGGSKGGGVPPMPGPETRVELPARPDELVDAYVAHLGAPGWEGQVPPHLFPQWAFPVSARVLAGLPYPMARTLNAGCRLVVRGPIPRGEPLIVRARLVQVDDDGRRVLIKQRIVTSTPSSPDAIEAELTALVPLKGSGGGGTKKERATVPCGATQVQQWQVGRWDGWEFAKLTGDVNPLHWVAPYAQVSGFKGAILHGFSTMARAYEGLRGPAGGHVGLLDVRFTRPLPLPSSPRLFIHDNGVYVGDETGGPAYMTGTWSAEAP